ncbi:MAG: DUF3327 domain-containing protein [Microbacterium sp.]
MSTARRVAAAPITDDRPPPPRVETQALRALREGGPVPPVAPVIGAVPIVHDGLPHREVTFVWTPRAQSPGTVEVMVHITSVTDAHRRDITPALMEWMPEAGCAALGCLLPEGLVASYRLVVDRHIPRDAGRDRAGWKRIHELGAIDPRNLEQLPNPLGERSSVLRMPGSRRHPAELHDSGPVRDAGVRPLPIDTPWVPQMSAVVPAGRARGILVLFDAEHWEKLAIADLLARHPRGDLVTLLVPSGSTQNRAEFLPHPERAIQVATAALDAAHAARIVPDELDAGDVVVAGQSFGGLAAAAIVVRAPHLARTAIVQSGSFWYGADSAAGDDRGELLRSLSGAHLSGRRFVVQYGTQERLLGSVGRAFAAAAAAGGADVTSQQYGGGHDYAWWRTGLLDALD